MVTIAVVAHGLPHVSRSNPPSMRSGLMATSCRCNVSVSPCSSVSLGTTGLAQRENCGGRVAWLQVCSFPRLVCLLPSLTTLHGLFYHVEPHRSWNFRESCALRARLLNSDLHRLHSADELPGLNVASGTRQLETMWRFKTTRRPVHASLNPNAVTELCELNTRRQRKYW